MTRAQRNALGAAGQGGAEGGRQRLRVPLGTLLIAAAVAGATLPVLSDGQRKLVLTAVSITSSAAFVAAQAADRRHLRRLQSALPGSQRRTASLERRSTARYYHPAWELVPVGLLGATIAVTAWILPVLSRASDATRAAAGVHLGLGLAAVPLIQVAIVGIFLTHAWRGTGSGTPRLGWLRADPRVELELSDEFRRSATRHVLAIKIGVAALLTTIQLDWALSLAGNAAAAAFDHLSWLIVVSLLVVFARYVATTARVWKRAQRSVGAR